MTVDQLQIKWKGLPEKSDTDGFKSLLLSPDIHAIVFIGVNNKGNRCLILALPRSFKIDIRSVEKENLTIRYYPDSNYIALQLTDNGYHDLFDDLILSVLNRMKHLIDVESYAKEFIHTFYKWSEFFSDKKLTTLSEEALKGLIGELIVLQSFIEEADSYNVNDVLNSWKGPYDQKNDFVLNSKNIEVKTKDIASTDIKISSEHQLEADFEKGLELSVISLQADPVSGFTLNDLVLKIRSSIIERLGDTSILFKALMQKGLTSKNLQEYDNSRFKAVDEIKYDCNAQGFPRLTKSNIPPGINGLKYNIRLATLSEFIIFQKTFNYGDR
jgi:hypothetical protein